MYQLKQSGLVFVVFVNDPRQDRSNTNPSIPLVYITKEWPRIRNKIPRREEIDVLKAEKIGGIGGYFYL